jgi:hypothetical protein
VRGNLHQSTLAVLFRHLYAERKSGTLDVSSRGLVRRIYFRKGTPIFADAGPAERPPARPQAEAILCSTFSWTDGEFSFLEGDPAIDDKLSLGKPPAELILEGTRSIDDARALDRLIGTNGTLFRCSQTTELPLFSLKLSPAESTILKFARERERFRASDVAQVSSEFAVRRALTALVALGLLEIVAKEQAPEPAPPALAPALAPRQAAQPVPVPVAKPSPAPRPAAAVPVARPAPAPALARAPEPDPVPEIVAEVPPEIVPEPEIEPVIEPVIEEVPREVEQLFDRFEAKRVREVPPAQPTPQAAIEEELPMPAHPLPLPPAPSRATQGASRLNLKVWGPVVGALVVLAVALVLWLTGRSETGGEGEAVAAGAVPSEPVAPPQRIETEPEPAPGPSVSEVAVPSEAELFYQANLAFDNRDYDRARLELQTLLELKPDFTAAQNLLARVERELAAARAPAPAPKPAPRVVERAPEPKREEAKVPEPAKPDPGRIFEEAKSAFDRGDLGLTASKLEELRALDPTHGGARELRAQVEERRWEQTLPRTYKARHNHRIGGCDGTVSLTAQGLSYRSSEHEWMWSFAELARADRKNERELSVETRGKKSFNFQLRDPLASSDWSRFLALGNQRN